MRVAVVGAGIAGVTSAYYLARVGHDVTVIDGDDSVANGTSFANGAQLSYSFTDALARPAMLRMLPKVVAGLDQAIRVRTRPSREFVRWGIEFIRECTSTRAAENTLALLRQSMRSAELFAELRGLLPDDFSYRAAGKLVLLSDAVARRAAEYARDLKASCGCQTQVLSLEEVIEIEPAIEHMRHQYVGATYSKGDEVADARAFAVQLSQLLAASYATDFMMGTRAERLVVEKGRLRSIQTSKGPIDVDAAVLCTGVTGAELMKPLGIDAGICPVRGYSITLPPGEYSPSMSITDPGRRIVFSSLESGIRIAGFADFVGLNTTRDPVRINTLLQVAQAAAPMAADYDATSINGWGGFRAMRPDSRPRIESTATEGLFLNLGHGMLGWTLACSSGERVAQLVSGDSATVADDLSDTDESTERLLVTAGL